MVLPAAKGLLPKANFQQFGSLALWELVSWKLEVRRRRVSPVPASRIDRHPDDGVDSHGVELVDLLMRRDPAGGGQRRAVAASHGLRSPSMSVPRISPSRSTWV